MVLTNAPYAHNFSPLLDERPGVPTAEKFKALAGNHKTGLHAFKSADAVHWDPLQSEAVFRAHERTNLDFALGKGCNSILEALYVSA